MIGIARVAAIGLLAMMAMGTARAEDVLKAKVGVLRLSSSAPVFIAQDKGSIVFDGELVGVDNWVTGTIDTLTNLGTIRSSNRTGLTNEGHIGVLSNSGLISGVASGVWLSSGSIGALVNSTLGSNGAFLDEARFAPLLARFERLDVPLYLHPAPPPAARRPAHTGALDSGRRRAARPRRAAPCRPASASPRWPCRRSSSLRRG